MQASWNEASIQARNYVYALKTGLPLGTRPTLVTSWSPVAHLFEQWSARYEGNSQRIESSFEAARSEYPRLSYLFMEDEICDEIRNTCIFLLMRDQERQVDKMADLAGVECDFLYTLRQIRLGLLSREEQIGPLSNAMHDYTRQFLQSYRRDGADGFYNTFRAISPQHILLRDWSLLLDVPSWSLPSEMQQKALELNVSVHALPHLSFGRLEKLARQARERPVHIQPEPVVNAPVVQLALEVLEEYKSEPVVPEQAVPAAPLRSRALVNEDQAIGTLLSTVQEEEIVWLWEKRLALGKITILDGDPGMGKSLLTLDLGARVTGGGTMPDGTPGLRGGVVLITPEDGLGDTIRPRLARAGADLDLVVSLSEVECQDARGNSYQRLFNLAEDLPLLKRAIQRVQARLVVIDPVMAVIGNRDVFRDNDVRALLNQLSALMAECQCACVLVRHLTKGAHDNALYSGTGSIAFVAQVRIGLIVGKDPNDATRNILAHTKINIGEAPQALSYRIRSDAATGNKRPYVDWGPPSDLTAQEMLAPVPIAKPRTAQQEILDLLRENYPQEMSAQELHEELPDVPIMTIRSSMRRMSESRVIEKIGRGSFKAFSPS